MSIHNELAEVIHYALRRDDYGVANDDERAEVLDLATAVLDHLAGKGGITNEQIADVILGNTFDERHAAVCALLAQQVAVNAARIAALGEDALSGGSEPLADTDPVQSAAPEGSYPLHHRDVEAEIDRLRLSNKTMTEAYSGVSAALAAANVENEANRSRIAAMDNNFDKQEADFAAIFAEVSAARDTALARAEVAEAQVARVRALAEKGRSYLTANYGSAPLSVHVDDLRAALDGEGQ